jgi:hypothetical protein
MSPYQQIFSTNAVLSVWRNLRNTKDNNDLLLAFQYHQEDARGQKGKKYAKGGAVDSSQEVADGKAIDVGGKSIGFVVPWRAMQAQRRELKEKEKELAEALVALAGEVAFTGMYLAGGGFCSLSKHVHMLIIRDQTSLRPYSLHSPKTRSFKSVTLPLAFRARCRRSNYKWPIMPLLHTERIYTLEARLLKDSFHQYKRFSNSDLYHNA